MIFKLTIEAILIKVFGDTQISRLVLATNSNAALHSAFLSHINATVTKTARMVPMRSPARWQFVQETSLCVQKVQRTGSRYASIDLNCAMKNRIARMERTRRQRAVSIIIIFVLSIKLKDRHKRSIDLRYFFSNRISEAA